MRTQLDIYLFTSKLG